MDATEDGSREPTRLLGHHRQRTPDRQRVPRMLSLLRSVGRQASLCHRRSLFSAFVPNYSTRTGPNLLLNTPVSTAGKWLTTDGVNPSPLFASWTRTCSSASHMSFPTPNPEYRLPSNAKPNRYDLTVRTNLENQTFDGFVDVQCVTDPI